METFNVEYQAAVDAYLHDIREREVAPGIYEAIGSCFRAKKATEYRIPPEISEMSETVIIKKHAYKLKYKLKIIPRWHRIAFAAFNGQEFPIFELGSVYNSDIYECVVCEVNVYEHPIWWQFRDVACLCTGCYETCPFNTYRKEDFKLTSLPDVNFLDWVQFMSEDTHLNHCSGFYVNCNTESPYYGNIMNCMIDNDDALLDIAFSSVADMISEIHKWITQVPTDIPFRELYKTPASVNNIVKFMSKKLPIQECDGKQITYGELIELYNRACQNPEFTEHDVACEVFAIKARREGLGRFVGDGDVDNHGNLISRYTDGDILYYARKTAKYRAIKNALKQFDIGLVMAIDTNFRNLDKYDGFYASFTLWYRHRHSLIIHPHDRYHSSDDSGDSDSSSFW